jgi:hypothetical protein
MRWRFARPPTALSRTFRAGPLTAGFATRRHAFFCECDFIVGIPLQTGFANRLPRPGMERLMKRF